MIRSIRTHLLTGLVAIAAMVTAVVASGGRQEAPALAGPKPTLDQLAKIHPLLQAGAQNEPNARMRVLVTRISDGDKTRGKQKAKDIAASVDADEEDDFDLADTQSLVIKLKDVYKLAKHKDVRYISPDGSVLPQKGKKGKPDLDRNGRGGAAVLGSKPSAPQGPPDAKKLVTTYAGSIDADKVWESKNEGATGRGVTVAVLDTGVNLSHPDFATSSLVAVTANRRALGGGDGHGHGTHVAGIINGRSADGKYAGIAPDARVISVKVADDDGDATEGDLLRGLQWVYDNRLAYNIRVVNLSISAAVPSSYVTSPIAAAVEKLWFAGVVVVAASGNQGSAKDAVWHAPGNDPYIITVGCLDDNGTDSDGDDSQCTFSSRGTTQDMFIKPDVLAPGRKIVAPLADRYSTLGKAYPDRITPDGQHIRLSGTSAAAPVVAGLVALLLERYPSLTPDQVKSALMTTSRGYKGMTSKNGVVDADKALQVAKERKTGTANQGLRPSTALDPVGGAVGQTQTYWDQTYWDQTYWDQTYWDQTYWDQVANFD